MTAWLDDEEATFVVVVNGEAQYSIWPRPRAAARLVRRGHERPGPACLEHIDKVWTRHAPAQPARAPCGARALSNRFAPWFVPLGRADANAPLRVFMFPFAGGGPMALRAYGTAWPAGVAVYAAQMPGREQRIGEPPVRRAGTRRQHWRQR